MRDRTSSLDNHQRFAEFHRLTVLEQNLNHGAGARGGNLVHRFHRFHDQQRIAGFGIDGYALAITGLAGLIGAKAKD